MVIVDDAVTTGAVNGRKHFFAQGLHWFFYFRSGAVYFKTSSDRVAWSDRTLVRASTSDFDLFFDGTYVHYAVASTNLFYRRGLPSSDGAITWDAEQTAYSAANDVCYSIHICVDSDGYPWIGFRITDTDAVPAQADPYGTPYATKSSAKDGTWTTDTGFPYQLSTSVLASYTIIPVEMTNSKVYVIYGPNPEAGVYQPVYGKLYDAGWGSEETVFAVGPVFNDLNAGNVGGDDIAATTSSHNSGSGHYVMRYNKRSSDGWGTSQDLVDTGASYSGVSYIAYDADAGNIHFLWNNATSINDIIILPDGTVMSSAVIVSGLSLVNAYGFSAALKNFYNSVDFGYANEIEAYADYDVCWDCVPLPPASVKSSHAI